MPNPSAAEYQQIAKAAAIEAEQEHNPPKLLYAIDLINMAIELDPGNGDYHWLKADCYLNLLYLTRGTPEKQDYIGEGIKCATTAIKINPKLTGAYLTRIYLMWEMECPPEQVLHDLEQCIQLNPMMDFYLMRGDYYMWRGSQGYELDAARSYLKALRLLANLNPKWRLTYDRMQLELYFNVKDSVKLLKEVWDAMLICRRLRKSTF